MSLNTEVCVVGGGPAGSTIAGQLAALGHDVLLLEAQTFPRAHIGESLPPSIVPLFETLQVWSAIEAAGFLRTQATIVHWAGEAQRTPQAAGQPGLQVDRGRLDLLLLQHAYRHGVRVLQPARAVAVQHTSYHDWRLSARLAQQETTITCRFLIDASGRWAFLRGRRLGLAPPTLAMFGYWRGVPFDGPETRIEAGVDQWYWGAPLPDGTCNATVFLAPDHLRRVGAHEAGYRRLLMASPLLHGCVAGTLGHQVQVCAATPFYAAEVIGADWIKIGEAAFALDPLSSQGVQTALVSGLQGTSVVHTILTDPDATEIACSFYQQRITSVVERNAEIARAHYRRQVVCAPTPFWLSRSGLPGDEPTPAPPLPPTLDEYLELDPAVRVVHTPVLAGPLIRLAPAVLPPGQRDPVAFVAGVPLTSVLPHLRRQRTTISLLASLASAHGSQRGLRLFEWMVASRVVRICTPAMR